MEFKCVYLLCIWVRTWGCIWVVGEGSMVILSECGSVRVCVIGVGGVLYCV